MIEHLPVFLGKTWLRQHRDYVLNMSVNAASNASSLASWKMQGLHGNIELSLDYRPPFYVKMVEKTSLLCPKNERQWSVNNFWPGILEMAWVMRRH